MAMSIKRRLEQLERRQPASNFKHVVLVPVRFGETEEQAVERWKLENPGEPPPDQIIFLVPFGYERSEAA
jgi:hypothetical protein